MGIPEPTLLVLDVYFPISMSLFMYDFHIMFFTSLFFLHSFWSLCRDIHISSINIIRRELMRVGSGGTSSKANHDEFIVWKESYY